MREIILYSMTWHDFGLITSDMISKTTTIIDKLQNTVCHLQYNMKSVEPVQEDCYKCDTRAIKEFFRYLDTSIEGMLDDYRVMVMDGSAWDMELRFDDQTTRIIKGTVDPPPNGEEIQRRINALARVAES